MVFMVGDDNMLTILHGDDDSLMRIRICSTSGVPLETQGSVAVSGWLQYLCIGTQTGCILLYDMRRLEKPLLCQRTDLHRSRAAPTVDAIRALKFLDPCSIIASHHKEYITRLSLSGVGGEAYSCPHAESFLIPEMSDISGMEIMKSGILVASPRRFAHVPLYPDYIRSVCL